MELVLVDDEKAAPVHNNKLNAAPPVHNKLNRTLSSASDETMRASAEAPAQERRTLEDRPPSFLRRIFAGHTPHTSGRKRFVPKRPVKENRRYAPPTPPRRSWSFSSRGWAFPPGYTGQSPQPRSKKTARKSVVSRLRSAVRSVTQLRQWASPRPTARRASFANRKALPADPGLAQPAAVL